MVKLAKGKWQAAAKVHSGGESRKGRKGRVSTYYKKEASMQARVVREKKRYSMERNGWGENRTFVYVGRLANSALVFILR